MALESSGLGWLARACVGSPLGSVASDIAGHLRGRSWAPVAFVLLGTAWLGFSLPVGVLLLAGGLAFGARGGGALDVATAMLGASLAYGLARRLALRRPGFIAQRLARLLARAGEPSKTLLIGLRVVPFMPFGALSYTAGFSRIPFSRFAIATFIGILPEVVVYTLLADSLERKGPYALTLLAVSTPALALTALSILLFERHARRRSRLRAAEATQAGQG